MILIQIRSPCIKNKTKNEQKNQRTCFSIIQATIFAVFPFFRTSIRIFTSAFSSFLPYSLQKCYLGFSCRRILQYSVLNLNKNIVQPSFIFSPKILPNFFPPNWKIVDQKSTVSFNIVSKLECFAERKTFSAFFSFKDELFESVNFSFGFMAILL